MSSTNRFILMIILAILSAGTLGGILLWPSFEKLIGH